MVLSKEIMHEEVMQNNVYENMQKGKNHVEIRVEPKADEKGESVTIKVTCDRTKSEFRQF